jgi:hypothetical protein
MKIIEIADWILNKNLSAQERTAFYNSSSFDECKIIRTTDNALLVKFFTDFGTFTSWFPKSQCSYT